ncbi:3'-5' ssDNA/RNA exonuclease TatD [Verrucomicrobiota bacterium]|nr:3'-5' ssDNA/RNA exonuclease TatD [Verrucomicrobiota bacterium]
MGLDRWVEGFDPVAQEAAFRAQLALAVELDRPLTIHCVRAIGPLMDILRATERPRRGFLLHSWNGPVELVLELARLGAYFSFSAHHFPERKAHLREQFAAAIPRERVLVETDAPALCPAPAYESMSCRRRPMARRRTTRPTCCATSVNWLPRWAWSRSRPPRRRGRISRGYSWGRSASRRASPAAASPKAPATWAAVP